MTKSTDTLGGWYPGADRIGIPDTNFASGNQGRRAVCVHVMGGSMLSTISWFTSNTSRVSAHFGIDRAGNIKQFVSTFDTAYANGLSYDAVRGLWIDPAGNMLAPPNAPSWALLTPPTNPNRTVLSIEREGYPSDPITPAMHAATVALLRWLAEQYPAFRPYAVPRTLIGHRHLAPIHRANCPGPATDLAALAMAANATPAPNPLATHSLPGPDGRKMPCGEGFHRLYAERGGFAVLGYALTGEVDGQDCTWLRCERAVLKYSTPYGLELAQLEEAKRRGWI
jgi:hypothetical protein